VSAAAHAQAAYAVRCEHGPTGGLAVVAGPPPVDVAVVVDVLSFTTTLDVAVGRGVVVHPYRWRDDGAEAYAAARDAVLAVGRFEATRGAAGAGVASRAVSLSPAALLARPSVSDVPRLVLPSPNGSSISFDLASGGAVVAGACLRNAPAVARWLAPGVAEGARLAVVAAGERWPDGSLRPAVEDLWGAGAVLAALRERVGTTGWSPEARAAAAAFDAVSDSLVERLRECASGRELSGAGFADDVAVAAAYDVSSSVPVLDGDAFRGG